MSEQLIFSRFAPFIQEFIHHSAWQELRPVQVESARAIFDSKADVLITTGTASGKTEAAFLPILSLIHADPGDSVQALYVGPLRALINDQFRRLELVCERGGIPVHRWHGDVGQAEKAKLLKAPRGVLQITPESIESLFLNKTQHLRRLFQFLRFIMVDETHTFLNSDRGVQLAVQLQRLERYVEGRRPRRIGLSATVGDADRAQQWLNPRTPESVLLVNPAGSGSSVRMNLLHLTSSSPNLAHELLDDLYQLTHNQRSLIFCNRRADVEFATRELNRRCEQDRFDERYLPHHGSISKELREEAERRMKEDERPSSVVCTNTLELGIDIGQLDLVVQINSTHLVSAFAQRLGRSGRRAGSPRVIQMYTTEQSPEPGDPFYAAIPFSLLQALAVVDLFQEKWVEPPQTSRCAYNVLYHQMLSYLAEVNGATARQLVAFFAKSGVFPDVTPDDYETLLRHLAATGQMHQLANGELLPGLEGEKLLRSREFYAVFQSPPEWAVTHGTRHLGNISPPTINLQIDDNLLLSGRMWRIVDILPRSKKYLVEPAADSHRTHFPSTECPPIHPRVAQRMREILFRADTPEYLSADGQTALAEARRLAQAYALDRRIGFDSEGEVVLIPWTGTRTMAALARMFGRAECDPQRDGIWVLRLKSFSSLQRLKPILATLCQNPPNIKEFVSTPQASHKFDEFLPESLLQKREAEEQLNFEGAMRIVRELQEQIP